MTLASHRRQRACRGKRARRIGYEVTRQPRTLCASFTSCDARSRPSLLISTESTGCARRLPLDATGTGTSDARSAGVSATPTTLRTRAIALTFLLAMQEVSDGGVPLFAISFCGLPWCQRRYCRIASAAPLETCATLRRCRVCRRFATTALRPLRRQVARAGTDRPR